jgi:hypothetical protein
MASVRIRIRPDGTVEAVTEGLKGDDCLPYIARVEELTEGKVVSSYYTHEYHEGREQARAPVKADEAAEQPEIDIGGP